MYQRQWVAALPLHISERNSLFHVEILNATSCNEARCRVRTKRVYYPWLLRFPAKCPTRRAPVKFRGKYYTLASAVGRSCIVVCAVSEREQCYARVTANSTLNDGLRTASHPTRGREGDLDSVALPGNITVTRRQHNATGTFNLVLP